MRKNKAYYMMPDILKIDPGKMIAAVNRVVKGISSLFCSP
jgi:hypothetical protein